MKILSHTMAKAVMQFWHSVELLLDKDVPDHNCIGVSVEHDKVDSNEASRDKRKNSEKVLVIFFDLFIISNLNFIPFYWPIAHTLVDVVIGMNCYMDTDLFN